MADSHLANTTGSKRLLGLDLLRLLAIVLVLGRHMEPAPEGTSLAGLWSVWHINGGLGVDLFFVLSGFLVSGLLFGEYRKLGDISVKRFYVRRAWKIYPPFYFLMAFAYIYQWQVVGQRIRDRSIYSELLFIQNYNGNFWNHTWTLAVEEHFYLLLPLALLLLVRTNRGAKNPFRAVPYLVLASSIGFLAIRIVNFLVRKDYSYLTHVFATHLRLDSLCFGVAIAYAYHFHAEWFRRTFQPLRYVLIALGLSMLGAATLLPAFSGFYVHTFGFTQYYLAAGALMVGVLMCEIPTNRLTSSLATLGAYSYSIYLWHMALMYWAMPRLRELSVSWELRTALYIAGAFAIGITMAKLLELPALAYRDRMFPSRLGAAPPSATANPTLLPGPTATPSQPLPSDSTPHRRAA